MTDKHEIQRRILSVTEFSVAPLVPELKLALVTPRSPWWTMTPESLEVEGVPEPFWGFAWGGGQCVARYILDHPDLVRDKPVIDFGAGGGIISLAALKAGASQVFATEIDPWAIVALEINLCDYLSSVTLSCEDWIGRTLPPGTVVLCGDMSYEKRLTQRMLEWFHSLRDCLVIIGDPGRGFLDASLFLTLMDYRVPTDSDFDGSYFVKGSVMQFIGCAEPSLPTMSRT